MIQKRLALFVSGIFLAAVAFVTESRAQDAAAAGAKDAPVVGGLGFTADLESTLDSKKAKAGDTVAARSTEVLKVGSKIIFPKGTKFVGHVTQASARGKGDADSLLAIQFDKAVLKGGEEMPVRLAIKAIAPPRQMASAGESVGQDPMAGTRAGTTTSPMGNSRSGPAADRSAGNPGNATGTDSDLTNEGQLTPESHGVYGMSGVRLAADVSKAVPVSVVSSNGKNLKLDSGTRMLLVSIADVPAKPNP